MFLKDVDLPDKSFRMDHCKALEDKYYFVTLWEAVTNFGGLGGGLKRKRITMKFCMFVIILGKDVVPLDELAPGKKFFLTP